TVASTMSRTCSPFATFTGKAMARRPVSWATASAVCSACSALRSATTTSHPSRASRKQMAAPSPWAPPETNAIRSVNIVSVFPLCTFASLRLRGSLLFFLALQHNLQQFILCFTRPHAIVVQLCRHSGQHLVEFGQRRERQRFAQVRIDDHLAG